MSGWAQAFLDAAAGLSLALVGLALVVTVVRIVKGPTLPDRVLGLDVLTVAGVGLVALVAIDTGFSLYVDITIALGLVGFLATAAFARFIEAKGKASEDPAESLPFADDDDIEGSEARGMHEHR
ncbi:MAG: cation:proton antiporter [Rhizobiaceae bacterium]|nr:cation:proton antiporter [Rhizobiaceae bacterium]